MNNFDTVLYKVVALNRSYSTNTQAIYNDDIPQEPENFRFDIVHIVRITSPELQPMTVQYHCHVIQTEITLLLYCTAIGCSNLYKNNLSEIYEEIS